jgi:triacylglycerol lipase
MGGLFPGVQYWRGIKEAMAMNGIELITAHVPASASIEERAQRLCNYVGIQGKGKDVNIIA